MRKIKLTIDCYISSGCTSEKPLKENVDRALSLEGVEAAVNFHKINEEEAVTIGLKGSPSIRMNGMDIMPGEISGFS